MADLKKVEITKRVCVVCEPGSSIIVTPEQYGRIKDFIKPAAKEKTKEKTKEKKEE